MSEDQDSALGVPRRVVLLIIAGILVTFVGSGILLFSRLSAQSEQQFEPVADYLEHPDQIQTRVEAVTEVLLRLEISRGTLEVYDGTGQHHSITQNGEWIRHDGAREVDTGSFPLSALDFTKVPAILASARTQGGASPTSLSAVVVEGAPRWRALVWAGGESKELDFALDGAPL